jgi:hypothetical protein
MISSPVIISCRMLAMRSPTFSSHCFRRVLTLRLGGVGGVGWGSIAGGGRGIADLVNDHDGGRS